MGFETFQMQAAADLQATLQTSAQKPDKSRRNIIQSPATEVKSEPLPFGLVDLLEVMREHNASDLHIKAGTPPMVRIYGELLPVGDLSLTSDHTMQLIFSACSRQQQERLICGGEVDLAFVDGGVRYRINAYLEKSTFSASIRMLNNRIPRFEDLYLPGQIAKFLEEPHGLLLVTGPTGSGKSTTLASMVDLINRNKAVHIVTIEDPIEYMHKDIRSVITQREVGSDTDSFYKALKFSLRQDPNIILIGEMRDPETIFTAATAAETGHMVMSTLHTANTIQAITRILDVFTGQRQQQMRLLLAGNLIGIISQRLLPRSNSHGRVPAVEVLVKTPTVASLILDNEVNDIYKYMVSGTSEGMQTMNYSLFSLLERDLISKEVALSQSDYPSELQMMIQGYISDAKSYNGETNPLSWI